MRNPNLIVTLLGIAALALATAAAWRWRKLQLLSEPRPAVDTGAAAALDGLRTLAAVMAAGVLAGVFVAGLGGRLVMRILGATSGESAQGALTEANQPVGEITSSGTIGVILFVGLLGGILAAIAYLVVRRWLPRTAGPAGLVAGILLLGTIGVGDALSPDNQDFAILHPTSLAVILVVALALLFGVTFTALAARFDAGMPTLRTGRNRVASHAALIFYLFPLIFAGAAVYLVGRVTLHGRLTSLLTSPVSQRIGRTIVGVATVVAAVRCIQAISDIAAV